ncbi:hypothetical protein [Catellatospora sichuanensis]|uniref:hypothetical protein n=1 Tax=Catellatospora sichuanensis TaxID=1969805 RepID=UPI001183EF15|nr:hypothetical protein [Catellatospora sichuanensis]
MLAAVGLSAGWRIDESGGDAGVVAALALLALAAGCLLAASAGGEVAVRVTGGALFVAGLGVVITHHEVWWWLPSSWVTPVSLVALVISLVGVGVLLLAYGFRLAGLSGALGLLALASFALTLPLYIGSDEKSVFRVLATAFGAVALAAGTRAAANGRMRVERRAITAVAGVLGAAVTVYAGFDSYPVYAPGSYHAAVIGATILGAMASLALGVAVSRPNVVDGPPRKDLSTSRTVVSETVVQPTAPMPKQTYEPPSHLAPEPPLQAPAEPAPPHPPAGPVTTPAVPTVVAIKPSLTTAGSPAPAAEPASRTPDRLQTASLAVGLVIGLMTIGKELIAAFLALVD